jgi:hypothetical protein
MQAMVRDRLLPAVQLGCIQGAAKCYCCVLLMLHHLV